MGYEKNIIDFTHNIGYLQYCCPVTSKNKFPGYGSGFRRNVDPD